MFGAKLIMNCNDGRFDKHPYRPTRVCHLVTREQLLLGGNKILYRQNPDGKTWVVAGACK